jgi:hypothetical protein
MASVFYGEFSFRGDDFLPEEITAILGIAPSQTWEKGKPRNPKNLNTKAFHPNNGWAIRTENEMGEDDNIEEHIKLILEKLKPVFPKIKEICVSNKKIDAIICCVVVTTDANPQVSFEPDVVKQISDMGASIWFDVYALSELPETWITNDSKIGQHPRFKT